MLIRAYSDFHGVLPIVEPCDVLLIAGDVCKITDSHLISEQETFTSDIFARWLASVPAKIKIITWGNHDFIGEVKYPEDFHGYPATFLVDEGVAISNDLKLKKLDESKKGDLKIFGSPWCPNLTEWAFYGDSIKLAEKAELIPKGMDIWLMHSPPIYYGDQLAKRPYSHVGNPQIIDALDKKGPKLYLCGHIHEGYGHYWYKGVDICNVSFLDENYVPRHRHMAFNWDGENITRVKDKEQNTGELWYNCLEEVGGKL